ncbi:MAG: hypothetical protein ACRC8J_02950 [Phocaeicola sp.]
MKEENDIRRKCGTDNPFTVPEGYFENFAKNMMDKLPEKEIVEEPETTFWQRSKPWLYMAAMFVGMMFSIRLFVGDPNKEQPLLGDVTTTAVELSEEEMDEMMDYSMIDDYTVYRYLTDASGFDF